MDLQKYYEAFEQHLLEDKQPSIYFKALLKNHTLPKVHPFDKLIALKETEQSPLHHPEGHVWEHTMLVIDYAALVRDYSLDAKVFMWAALLHDIGKSTTTRVRRGKITAYDHDKEGAVFAEEFLRKFIEDEKMIIAVKRMVRWHMQPLFVVKQLPFAEMDNMLLEVHPAEIGLFSICDRLGRGKLSTEKIDKEMTAIINFLDICRRYVEESRHQRIDEIKALIQSLNFDKKDKE